MALRNPSPEILRLEGPDMSPPPELSPVSRELLAAGRDKVNDFFASTIFCHFSQLF